MMRTSLYVCVSCSSTDPRPDGLGQGPRESKEGSDGEGGDRREEGRGQSGVRVVQKGPWELCERKAAERREQQRKKEEERKKESRGRSRSRKRRRGRKKKREAVPEPREGTSGTARRRAKRDRTPEIRGGEQRRVVLKEAKEVRLAKESLAGERKAVEELGRSESDREPCEEESSPSSAPLKVKGKTPV